MYQFQTAIDKLEEQIEKAKQPGYVPMFADGGVTPEQEVEHFENQIKQLKAYG